MGVPESELGKAPQPLSAAGQDARSHVKLGPGELRSLKKRVDDALRELESSAGSKDQLGQQVLPSASFGASSFSEAADLSRMYERVHTHLTKLSQTLGDQIEAMGIAVLGTQHGFEAIDEEQRRRYHEIRTRTQERYDEQHEKPRDKRDDRKHTEL
ncbi:hypothetical protein [Streptomyces ochraceiscleroticus]|uniref:Conjugal transfer protein TraB n=1 Tax=Streptomyces ochraceiscleroticus TaxID=47761 RepID=A0ABW1MCL8_9ACTN|nr:hypothetical protein [Streptomyces ochraceiscleroticus]